MRSARPVATVAELGSLDDSARAISSTSMGLRARRSRSYFGRMALVRSLFHSARRSMVELALAICRAVSHRFSSGATQSPFMARDRRAGCLRFVPRRRQCLYLRMIARHIFLCVEHESSNQPMKPTVPSRNKFSVFATAPWISSRCPATLVRFASARSHTPAVMLFNACRGLSLSR